MAKERELLQPAEDASPESIKRKEERVQIHKATYAVSESPAKAKEK